MTLELWSVASLNKRVFAFSADAPRSRARRYGLARLVLLFWCVKRKDTRGSLTASNTKLTV